MTIQNSGNLPIEDFNKWVFNTEEGRRFIQENPDEVIFQAFVDAIEREIGSSDRRRRAQAPEDYQE